MANFVALVDPDRARRAAFLKRAREEIAPVPGLPVRHLEAGPFAAVWAAGTRAPVSVATDGVRQTSILWGDAYGEESRSSADSLARAWAPAREGGRATPLDGYHAGVVYGDGRLVAGGDLLGLFPLYYGSATGVTIVASSPALLPLHPVFPAVPDQAGLAGTLLLGGSFRGRTLFRGIRRLSSGRLLVGGKAGPAEVEYYGFPDGVELASVPEPERVRALDGAYASAVARQLPGNEPTGFLLSGGRDSRMIAGYLRNRGESVEALSLGQATDLDAACARRVARRLGFRFRLHPLDPESFAPAAIRHARWEQLATGFSTVHMWSVLDALALLPPRFATGYFADTFFSNRRNAPVGPPFEIIFPALNLRGVQVESLQQLLRTKVMQGRVDQILAELREDYEAMPFTPLERGLRFLIANGERWHSGSVPWRLSFASWPVLPCLDRRVLDTLAALPPESLAQRWIQDALIISRFRDLARLPLDGNGPDAAPLIPPRWEALRRRLSRIAKRAQRRRGPPPERRYFHRIYDFNGPGWKEIRRTAEPHRERLSELFDMDALARFLPGPDVPVPFDEPIWGSAGHKMVVGLMLWSADYLS